jgi:predicted nucleic acid-binding protein
MADRILVDTNVLLYAYDRGAPEKQPRATATLDRLVRMGRGVLTPQVLAEFYVNATRKLEPPLTPEEAYVTIQNYLASWEVIAMTGQIVLEAARGVHTYQLSYWDAQIWASARLYQIPVILSEDFNTGAVLEGVRFMDPFTEEFDLESWFPA